MNDNQGNELFRIESTIIPEKDDLIEGSAKPNTVGEPYHKRKVFKVTKKFIQRLSSGIAASVIYIAHTTPE